MANFNTHLSVALVASTAVATLGLTMGLYSPMVMIMLSFTGAIGGLLPDIDLDNAKITRIGFNFASIVIASYATAIYASFNALPLMDLLIGWGALVLLLRFGVFALFSRLTRHRGMVHSVPYMAVLALLSVYGFYYFVPTGRLAWAFGGFLFFGAIIHLVLDEIYSVNIFGLKLKKSFGSALKFFDKKQLPNYVLLYGLLIGLWLFAPAKDELAQLLFTINLR